MGRALEDEGVGSLRQERRDPVDHVGGGVFRQEGGPDSEGGGVYVVEACLNVEKEGGDPEPGSLMGSDFVCQREAGV